MSDGAIQIFDKFSLTFSVSPIETSPDIDRKVLLSHEKYEFLYVLQNRRYDILKVNSDMKIARVPGNAMFWWVPAEPKYVSNIFYMYEIGGHLL
jgi:hypothetical protein